MARSRMKLSSRPGFTLVEVALTVAVGLIILGGAVWGYQAVKDNAASAMARRKVQVGAGIVTEYAASNFGRFPTSVAGATGGEFSSLWKSKFPDEYNLSPWGGQTADTVDGAVEYAPITDAADTEAAAPDKTTICSTDQTQAANVIYVSIQGAGYCRFRQLSNPDAYIGRGYCLSIYDRHGQPWFHLATNK